MKYNNKTKQKEYNQTGRVQIQKEGHKISEHLQIYMYRGKIYTCQ